MRFVFFTLVIFSGFFAHASDDLNNGLLNGEWEFSVCARRDGFVYTPNPTCHKIPAFSHDCLSNSLVFATKTKNGKLSEVIAYDQYGNPSVLFENINEGHFYSKKCVSQGRYGCTKAYHYACYSSGYSQRILSRLYISRTPDFKYQSLIGGLKLTVVDKNTLEFEQYQSGKCIVKRVR